MIKNQKNKMREVDDMIETVKEEEKKKTDEASNDHQTFYFLITIFFEIQL